MNEITTQSNRLPVPTGAINPDDPIKELPRILRPLIDEPTARLIQFLRWGGVLPDDRKKQAIKVLTDLWHKWCEYSQRASDEMIKQTLNKIANTFQVRPPNKPAVEMYCGALSILPEPVFKAAAIGVVRKHRYSTIPLPADFLSQEEAVEWIESHEQTNAWLETFVARQQVLLAT